MEFHRVWVLFPGWGSAWICGFRDQNQLAGKKIEGSERRVFIREDGTNYLGGMFDVEDIWTSSIAHVFARKGCV